MSAQTEKAQHTPGPWEVERPFGERGLYVQARDTSLVVKVYDENAANARLIAAAPQLLEALREIAEADPNDFGSFELAEFQDKARAAIKEATGE